MSHFICQGVGFCKFTTGLNRSLIVYSSSKSRRLLLVSLLMGLGRLLRNVAAMFVVMDYFLGIGAYFFYIFTGFQSLSSLFVCADVSLLNGTFFIIFFFIGAWLCYSCPSFCQSSSNPSPLAIIIELMLMQQKLTELGPIPIQNKTIIEQTNGYQTNRQLRQDINREPPTSEQPSSVDKPRTAYFSDALGEHPKAEIYLKACVSLQELIKQEGPELLTPGLRAQSKKQLQLYVFIFTIKYEHRQWQLRKKFSEFLEFSHIMKKKFGRETPSLPLHKENQVTPSNVGYFSDFLIIFLRKVIQIGIDDDQVANFLQILPRKYGSGIIYTEVRLKKLSGGRYYEATCYRKFKNTFCGCCRNWRKRYFTVTDQCVFYTIQRKSYEIKQMLAFSNNFKIDFGLERTGFELGIVLKSAYRNLQLQADTLYDFALFVLAVRTSLRKSNYSQVHRFSSYAGVRSGCSSRFYVDGEEYFSDLCDELHKARKFVYITDWMLTPYLLLKRPAELDDHSCRVDYVLEAIAQKGVKIYIILYMEPKIALNNDSQFVEIYLMGLHKNIKVLRHPNYILVPFLWSHHEKMVVIDEKCAFTGGLDLCYGRWDTQRHHLTNHRGLWKGADFCNFRQSDIYRPRNFLISNLDNMLNPRMPWHDIAIQIRGQSVIDLSRHFVQYWNFVSFQTNFNDRELLIQAGHQPRIRKSTFFWNKGFFNSVTQNSHPRVQIREQMMGESNQQNQYYQKFLETNFKRLLQPPKLPKIKLHTYLNDIKQYPKKILNYITQGQQPQEKDQRLMISHASNSPAVKLGSQTHQILRSASQWSLGLDNGFYESSIYQAYKDMISNAKQFIYIENQFFICRKNIICSLLAQRILRAHQQGQKFRVIIMLPLLPGFQGEIDDVAAAVMRVQLSLEYQTIARGKNSLFAQLSSIPDISQYLQVLSLRTHAQLQNSLPVTEIVYIHSKLMIVDDLRAILGSANINDRSLLGDRDSEIGIIVQEQNLAEIKGRKVSKSINYLRCLLYREHFNVNIQEAADYHNDQVWRTINEKASSNTKLYRQIFGCYPDNLMKAYKDIVTFRANAQPSRYQEASKLIDGFVVEWPMYFLEKEDLGLKPSQKQFFVPEINFT